MSKKKLVRFHRVTGLSIGQISRMLNEDSVVIDKIIHGDGRVNGDLRLRVEKLCWSLSDDGLFIRYDNLPINNV